MNVNDNDVAGARRRIFALATRVLVNEELAERWLATPNKRFDSGTPLETLRTSEGTLAVEKVLLQAYFGNFG